MALYAVFFILGLNGSDPLHTDTSGFILLEDGSYLLLEDSSRFVRE